MTVDSFCSCEFGLAVHQISRSSAGAAAQSQPAVLQLYPTLASEADSGFRVPSLLEVPKKMRGVERRQTEQKGD